MNSAYKNLLMNLLPKGRAWSRESEVLGSLIEGAAVELGRVDSRGLQLLIESDPRSANELLEAWERLLGLPDECRVDEDITLQDRRNAIVAKLVARGNQNKALYAQLAHSMGYSVDVDDVIEFDEFTAGRRAGLTLSNGPWRYAFAIIAQASDSVRFFRAGLSAAGERLSLFGDDAFECLIEKNKPAHTVVLFIYQ